MDENDIVMHNVIFDDNNEERGAWIFCRRKVPRSEIIFIVQAALVFALVSVSITCLAVAKTCEETSVWIAILSSSVGYMLPSPKL